MTADCEAVRDLAAGFVLGALEPDEEQAVREHLATCARPHDEFAELGGVVPYLAETVELVEPPAALKGRVLAAARADLASRPRPVAAPPVAPFPGPRERDARRVDRSRQGWLVRIAAALLLVALGGWNVLLQGQLQDARDYERALAAVLDVAAEPGSVTTILAGAEPGGPRGLAAVTADGRVVIALRDLTPTTGTQVYEAWVIVGDAGPVPIGGFAVGSVGIATFAAEATPATAGAVLALTREPRPGATTPTLPILASGVAPTPPG
ncbi:MAG: anti-sigma factor [Chloroflexota bacterium]|nr:anti-sigma factor [Chloroflexota bacterium]